MAANQGHDSASTWPEPIATPNRKYKDTLFRDLFGSPERKANALELYNALNGTDYDDPDALELTTLDDVIYLNVKNDVSFLLADEMVLWEHQSTPNPNMPLRGLIYFGRLYSAYAEREGLDLYGCSRLAVPAPRYVVFYAGRGGRPDRETLRLSDMFGGEDASVEVVCEVVNVNPGCNPQVAAASPTLAGYSRFVGLVREYNVVRGMPLGDAVDRAMDECIAEGHLTEYLREKRAEVRDMFMTEFDEEKRRQLDRQEGYEDGRKEERERAAERLRAAGYGEEIARVVLGLSPDEPLPPKPGGAHGSFLTEYDEERRRALDRQHGYEEGIEDGIGQAAERLRAAGYDEEIAQVVLGLSPDEPFPPKPDGAHGSFMTEYDEERRRALDRQHGYDEGVEDGIGQGIAQAAERLRAAGYDEKAIRIALGSTA